MAVNLSEANRRALDHVRERADASVAAPDARVTLHFHPGRLLPDGRTVAAALLDEGVYRNQFETGVSNGSLTAVPGGDRDNWERALFGGAYHAPGVQAGERPRYGGLNLDRLPGGTCPGFGSCHLRLRESVAERTTFTFGDSVTHPTAAGTHDAFGAVQAELDERVPAADALLALSEYVEAQVHGPVRLAEDVEALVADPAFAGTHTGELLRATADRHGFALEWHPGWVLALEAVPRTSPRETPWRWQAFCRDGHAARFAQHVIEQTGAPPHLDAAVIDQAAATDWCSPTELRDNLKDIWVIVVAHGSPRPD